MLYVSGEQIARSRADQRPLSVQNSPTTDPKLHKSATNKNLNLDGGIDSDSQSSVSSVAVANRSYRSRSSSSPDHPTKSTSHYDHSFSRSLDGIDIDHQYALRRFVSERAREPCFISEGASHECAEPRKMLGLDDQQFEKEILAKMGRASVGQAVDQEGVHNLAMVGSVFLNSLERITTNTDEDLVLSDETNTCTDAESNDGHVQKDTSERQ